MDVRRDLRFTAGLLNLRDAGRFLGLPRQTFHRWAAGYEKGEPLRTFSLQHGNELRG